MKLRKVALILILTIAAIMVASIFSMSYAATGSRYLTIKELRASGYGYKVLEKKIWKICESNSSGTSADYKHTIYCLKGGPGFGSSAFGSGTPSVRHYTRYFDMKNPSSITGAYANAIPDTKSDTYKSLLWLLENIYVAPKTNASSEERANAAEYKKLLLDAAGIDGYITDDDIDAVQQLAVWHFTNNDGYKIDLGETFELWVNAIQNSTATYNPLSDEIGAGATDGWDRSYECQDLFDYLVDTAIQKGKTYTIKAASAPYELVQTKVTQKISGNNYIIGPFRINEISDTAGTLTGTFKNGNTVINPTLQNASGTRYNSLKDTVGKDFYIVIPFSDALGTISLEISGSYFDTDITYWSVEGAPSADQPVVEVEKNKKTYTDSIEYTPTLPTGKYELELLKVDGEDQVSRLEDAEFEVTLPDGSKQIKRTDSNGKFNISDISITSAGTQTITLKETKAPSKYVKNTDIITLKVTTVLQDEKYIVSGVDVTTGATGVTKSFTGNKITIQVENNQFDLALRKFITKINGKAPTETRVPQVTVTRLNNGETTAEKTHTKTPLAVNSGDTVLYTIRIYNEGRVDGYAKEITDYLPEGLILKTNSSINTENGWTNPSGDGKTIVTTKLANRLLKKFNGTTLDYADVQVECTVSVQNSQTSVKLRNIAEITKATDKDGNDVEDRDSTPKNLTDGQKQTYNPGESEKGWGYEDDDDYEDLVLPGKIFDLALRKFIVQVNGKDVEPSREPKVDVTRLNDGKDTAEKAHTKTPIRVAPGDTVLYTIRVYNEGELNGYAKEITDYLPEGLTLKQNSTINAENGWTNPSGDGRTIITTKLADRLLNKFNGTTLDYADVQIECIVSATDSQETINLKNVAEITAATDENGKEVTDIDSDPKNLTDDQKDKYNPGESEKGWGYEDDDDYEELVIPGKIFDLALRKFITEINGKAPTETREPKISSQSIENLKNGTNGTTTAHKEHPKNALTVKTGDTVLYTIRVYNEGEMDGYVREITDYLPEGLKYIENSNLNRQYGWKVGSDGKTVSTDITSPDTENAQNRDAIYANRTQNEDKVLLKAFDGKELDYIDIQIECEVIATMQEKDNVLKNIAEITKQTDTKGDTPKDRDSTPDNVKKDEYGTTNQEDDDDFEQLVLTGKYFDLSLRKFITEINQKSVEPSREPKVDVTPLLNGETTAIYKHSKNPIHVDIGDIVTYTIRVYNEGQIDGYVDEITDHLPEWLEFMNDEFNAKYGWKVSSDGRTVTTDITSLKTEYSASRDTIYANRTENEDKVLLKAFDTTSKELDYIDVQIRCKVKDSGIAEKITNIAEITKRSDSTGSNLKDRDNESEVTLPADPVLPEYRDDEINRGDEYIPGQEDDDDFEKVIVQKFDLALRKFITKVNDKEISSRIPVFSMDKDGKMTYSHPKTPVEVANGDIVIYTIRVYNEGNQSGYANEVKDNLPEGLVYLPENELNKTYRWKMYKEDGTETTKVEEAKSIRTDYLSKEQEDATGRNNLIKAFNKNTMTQPDHKDVKIAFKVTEPNTSNRILINTAEISDDRDEEGKPVEDIDSTPDNDKEEEDDIDIEKVKVKYFDLALEKIVSEYTFTKNGKTTKNKTGHKFGVQPEPVVKVELLEESIGVAVIKFKYQIKVTNEGEIEGYATEIKDYIPEGLKFNPKDNPKWKLLDDGKTVTTDQLKDKLLKPGDSAVVEIVLEWINNENNLGLKQNWAEISKDKNDSDTPDIDSTPDNNKKGEDDIDDASVILSMVTGKGESYVLITGAVLSILATGIILIKKFVI